MRYWKVLGGLTSLAFKPNVLKKWAYGLKACIRIIEDLEQIRRSILEKNQLVQKEEGRGSIQSRSVKYTEEVGTINSSLAT